MKSLLKTLGDAARFAYFVFVLVLTMVGAFGGFVCAFLPNDQVGKGMAITLVCFALGMFLGRLEENRAKEGKSWFPF